MTDVVPPEKRSWMMSRIRGKDTKPEKLIRNGLHARGLRFRLHDKRLSGKPYLVFPKYNSVIFVNGCFWHGHDCHLFKWPKSRRTFWRRKITRSRQRDADSCSMLKDEGWYVLTIWECALKGRTRKALNTVLDSAADWIKHGSRNRQISGTKRRLGIRP